MKNKEIISSTGEPLSGHTVSFANMASSVKINLDSDEVKLIKSRLKNELVETQLRGLVTSDPRTSSMEIPYYKNSKLGLYQVLIDPPHDLQIMQDVNMLVLNELLQAEIVRVPYPTSVTETKLRCTKLGESNKLKRIYYELIFLLRLRDDIDYEHSRVNDYSKVTVWLMRRLARLHDANSKHLHGILIREEVEFLMKELDLDSDTLSFKCFTQLITALSIMRSEGRTLAVSGRLRNILSGSNSILSVKRVISDLKTIEPLHRWVPVTSVFERSVINSKIGKNVFLEQSKLFREFRSAKTKDCKQKLVDLQSVVDKNLPGSVKAVVYGRLKWYNNLTEKSEEVKQKLALRKGNATLKYAEILHYANKSADLGLFAEDCILATICEAYERSSEISSLTRNIKFNPLTGKMFYYKQDLEYDPVWGQLCSRVNTDIASKEEKTLHSFILSRLVTYMPGERRL